MDHRPLETKLLSACTGLPPSLSTGTSAAALASSASEALCPWPLVKHAEHSATYAKEYQLATKGPYGLLLERQLVSGLECDLDLEEGSASVGIRAWN